FVDKPELLGDPGADLARRTRKVRRHPDLQGLGLLGAHLARTAAHVEGGQAFDAAPFEKVIPTADRRRRTTEPSRLPGSSCRHPTAQGRWRAASHDTPWSRHAPMRS